MSDTADGGRMLEGATENGKRAAPGGQHVSKKRRKHPKPLRQDQCTFFMEHKQRTCSMQRKKGQVFCSEHMVAADGTRVPCPLDPKHSVWEKDLASHVKKCNAKPPMTHDPWYRENANTTLHRPGQTEGVVEAGNNLSEREFSEEQSDSTQREPTENESRSTQPGVSYQQLFALLDTFEANTTAPPKEIIPHAGLNTWLDAKANQKHIVQQASLIGHLQQAELLSTDNYYVEFGCGKAELSRAINTCVAHDVAENEALAHKQHQNYGFGLIDRGVNRMKMDYKIRTDSVLQPHVQRSRIDIEHLDLDRFLAPHDPDAWVGVSKHLCGVATDLTLKSIMNASAQAKLQGLVVAMCCRHVCDYAQLVPASRDFLRRHGVHTAEAFALLKKVVSWAVCGRRDTEGTHESGLAYEQRERYGFLARTLIDLSRVHAVEAMMPGFHAQLVRYAETDTTLENHCLVVRRRPQYEKDKT